MLNINPGSKKAQEKILHAMLKAGNVTLSGEVKEGARRWMFWGGDDDPLQKLLDMARSTEYEEHNLAGRFMPAPCLLHWRIWAARTVLELLGPLRGRAWAKVHGYVTDAQKDVHEKGLDMHKARDSLLHDQTGAYVGVMLDYFCSVQDGDVNADSEDKFRRDGPLEWGEKNFSREEASNLWLEQIRRWSGERKQWDQEHAAAMRLYERGTTSVLLLERGTRQGCADSVSAALKKLSLLFLGGPAHHRVVARCVAHHLLMMEALRRRSEEEEFAGPDQEHFKKLFKFYKREVLVLRGPQGERKAGDEAVEESIGATKRISPPHPSYEKLRAITMSEDMMLGLTKATDMAVGVGRAEESQLRQKMWKKQRKDAENRARVLAVILARRRTQRKGKDTCGVLKLAPATGIVILSYSYEEIQTTGHQHWKRMLESSVLAATSLKGLHRNYLEDADVQARIKSVRGKTVQELKEELLKQDGINEDSLKDADRKQLPKLRLQNLLLEKLGLASAVRVVTG